MRKDRQDLNKIGNELKTQKESFSYPYRPFLVHTSVSRTILYRPEVIT